VHPTHETAAFILLFLPFAFTLVLFKAALQSSQHAELKLRLPEDVSHHFSCRASKALAEHPSGPFFKVGFMWYE